MVISVLRLASAKLSAALWSAKYEPASRAVFTHLCSEDGENTKENTQSLSSAVSRTSTSSKCHCLWQLYFMANFVTCFFQLFQKYLPNNSRSVTVSK